MRMLLAVDAETGLPSRLRLTVKGDPPPGLALPPDLLVRGDGRYSAVCLDDGRLAFLRNRSGDFLRDIWGDALATDGEARFADLPGMACSADTCVASIDRGGHRCRPPHVLLVTIALAGL